MLGYINLFEASMDEQLPEGTCRNFKGFLMWKSQVVQELVIDLGFLEQEIDHLCNHMVIVSFVGQGPELYEKWLHELQLTKHSCSRLNFPTQGSGVGDFVHPTRLISNYMLGTCSHLPQIF